MNILSERYILNITLFVFCRDDSEKIHTQNYNS